MVRLALERSKTAKEAVNTIKKLIKIYGIGGNCGYDHKFLYDNSFLIMDRKNIFIIEISKNRFEVRNENMANISNCITNQKSKKKRVNYINFFQVQNKDLVV